MAGAPRDESSGSMRPALGAAPRSAIDRLPRRSLSVGATGRGRDKREYRLIAVIAKGGMGEVFLGDVVEPGRPPMRVVVKRLLEELREDESYVEMFRSEAEVMACLDHPNIVRVLDAPIIDGTRCMAMEYVRGRSVSQIQERCRAAGKPLLPQAALHVIGEVLSGLEHVHRARLEDGTPLGLVHRDMTPGNLLVSFDGQVKITDFGIAKSQMSAVSTTVGIVKGKARYLAPEQILGDRASPRSDLFSCACVLAEMLCGRPLFDLPTVPKTLYAIVNGQRPKMAEILPVKAPKLAEVLERALETEPRLRYESAADLRHALEDAARKLWKPFEREDLAALMRALFVEGEEPFERVDSARPTAPPSPAETTPGRIGFDPGESTLDGERRPADRASTTLDAPPPSERAPSVGIVAEPISESEARVTLPPDDREMRSPWSEPVLTGQHPFPKKEGVSLDPREDDMPDTALGELPQLRPPLADVAPVSTAVAPPPVPAPPPLPAPLVDPERRFAGRPAGQKTVRIRESDVQRGAPSAPESSKALEDEDATLALKEDEPLEGKRASAILKATIDKVEPRERKETVREEANPLPPLGGLPTVRPRGFMGDGEAETEGAAMRPDLVRMAMERGAMEPAVVEAPLPPEGPRNRRPKGDNVEFETEIVRARKRADTGEDDDTRVVEGRMPGPIRGLEDPANRRAAGKSDDELRAIRAGATEDPRGVRAFTDPLPRGMSDEDTRGLRRDEEPRSNRSLPRADDEPRSNRSLPRAGEDEGRARAAKVQEGDATEGDEFATRVDEEERPRVRASAQSEDATMNVRAAAKSTGSAREAAEPPAAAPSARASTKNGVAGDVEAPLPKARAPRPARRLSIAPHREEDPWLKRMGTPMAVGMLFAFLLLAAGGTFLLRRALRASAEGSAVVLEPIPPLPQDAPPEPAAAAEPAPAAEPSKPEAPAEAEAPAAPVAAKPEAAEPPKPEPTLEVASPKGARVRVDGALLPDRVPFRAHALAPGRHDVVVAKGKTRWTLSFDVAPGDHVVIDKGKVKRRKP